MNLDELYSELTLKPNAKLALTITVSWSWPPRRHATDVAAAPLSGVTLSGAIALFAIRPRYSTAAVVLLTYPRVASAHHFTATPSRRHSRTAARWAR